MACVMEIGMNAVCTLSDDDSVWICVYQALVKCPAW